MSLLLDGLTTREEAVVVGVSGAGVVVSVPCSFGLTTSGLNLPLVDGLVGVLVVVEGGDAVDAVVTSFPKLADVNEAVRVRALMACTEEDTRLPLPLEDTLDAGWSWFTDGPRCREDPLELEA
ncbi:hypothetical protein E2C01_028907 [Portunus trituberculatus]|uniref:Uncharacterized protein n=1 Tax=Portunus trituberculatus TaxID=210409 RepID=A0A5B7ERC1_PORTR|nr:hypothetical protein [Portunus trituberculatus]